MVASPPARTVTPSRSCRSSSASCLAYFGASLSLPDMLATISPVLRSSLIIEGTEGAVHADVTWTMCGEVCSCRTMSVPTARTAGLSTPSFDVTLTIIAMSP